MGGGDWVQQVAVPEVVVNIPKEEPNYWWLLTLAVIPVFVGWWLNRKGKK